MVRPPPPDTPRKTVKALKLNGHPFDLNPHTPTETKIIQYLDNSPADELYTLGEIAKRIGKAKSTINEQLRNPDNRIGPYRTHIGNKTYWGNPNAIAELLRQVAHESK